MMYMKENVALVFSSNLSRLRNSKKLTQAELAEALDLSLRAVQRYESGTSLPNTSVIDSIASKLNISIGDLFSSSQQAPASSGSVQQVLKSLAENADLIEMIANIDNAETIQLIKDFIKGNAEFEKSEVPKIPLYESPASCGAPIEATDNVIKYIPNPELPKGDYFACCANGDSMEPTILHNDILIFKKTNTAKMGEVVIAKVNGEITVKRLAKDKLEADNKKFKPIKGQAQVLGVLVKIQRDL